ncbi:MAG: hypothetical protein RJB66_1243 [Pseudomonadota bacterium]|jgi:hypothetical protein
MIQSNYNFFRNFIFAGLAIIGLLIFINLENPLTGTHKIRQADTLFTGYSYCIGDSTFLFPKIAHRESTSGVAIGEFPLFSALISIPCQLTGHWSEVPPKIITYFLWLLNLLIWTQWFKRRTSTQNHANPYAFQLFFIFSPLLLTYLLIPLPDALAVLILGLAALCWQRLDSKRLQWTGTFLFSLSFLMRPYLFPTLLILAPTKNVTLRTFGVCGIAYLLWFKYWIRHTEIWYYLTDIKPLSSLLASGWKAPSALLQQVSLNHMNYIGLIPFYFAVKRNKKLFFAWLSSILFIVVLKSDHFVNHAYYFMATGLITVVAMADGFLELNLKKQKIFTGLFVVMGVLAIQHNWRPPINLRHKNLPKIIKENNVAFEEKIAVYDTFDPQTLYLAKRVGWYFEKADWNGPQSCPTTARWALLFDSKDNPHLIACQK